jgi:hypothetical protein
MFLVHTIAIDDNIQANGIVEALLCQHGIGMHLPSRFWSAWSLAYLYKTFTKFAKKAALSPQKISKQEPPLPKKPSSLWKTAEDLSL